MSVEGAPGVTTNLEESKGEYEGWRSVKDWAQIVSEASFEAGILDRSGRLGYNARYIVDSSSLSVKSRTKGIEYVRMSYNGRGPALYSPNAQSEALESFVTEQRPKITGGSIEEWRRIGHEKLKV